VCVCVCTPTAQTAICNGFIIITQLLSGWLGVNYLLWRTLHYFYSFEFILVYSYCMHGPRVQRTKSRKINKVNNNVYLCNNNTLFLDRQDAALVLLFDFPPSPPKKNMIFKFRRTIQSHTPTHARTQTHAWMYRGETDGIYFWTWSKSEI